MLLLFRSIRLPRVLLVSEGISQTQNSPAPLLKNGAKNGYDIGCLPWAVYHTLSCGQSCRQGNDTWWWTAFSVCRKHPRLIHSFFSHNSVTVVHRPEIICSPSRHFPVPYWRLHPTLQPDQFHTTRLPNLQSRVLGYLRAQPIYKGDSTQCDVRICAWGTDLCAGDGWSLFCKWRWNTTWDEWFE